MGRAAAHLAVVCLPRAYSLWAFYALNKYSSTQRAQSEDAENAKYKYKFIRGLR